jgi:hypothetical protein
VAIHRTWKTHIAGIPIVLALISFSFLDRIRKIDVRKLDRGIRIEMDWCSPPFAALQDEFLELSNKSTPLPLSLK